MTRSSGLGPWLALARSALWPALIPGGLLFVVLQTTGYQELDMIGVDTHAYWRAARNPDTWYDLPPAYRDAYLYSPLFAQLLWPLGQLPWPAFHALWLSCQVVVLGWLLAPLGWMRGCAVALFCVPELLLGNVYVFFAATLVLGVTREPGAFAFHALTKIAPAVVGLWHPLRGDWRGAVRSAGVTLGLGLSSFAVAPDAWKTWLTFLATSTAGDDRSLPVRLVAALLIVAIAARRKRSWLLAPAIIMASPVLGGYSPLVVLAALPRLLAFDREAAAYRAAVTATRS